MTYFNTLEISRTHISAVYFFTMAWKDNWLPQGFSGWTMSGQLGGTSDCTRRIANFISSVHFVKVSTPSPSESIDCAVTFAVGSRMLFFRKKGILHPFRIFFEEY